MRTADRLSHGLAFARRRLRRRGGLYTELRREIERLGPWYQPVDLGGGLVAPARSKTGVRYEPESLDRGLGKWRSFVEPNLPSLEGKRVLEVGCNAGMLLLECLRLGAREAIGLEPDERYYRQARFVAGAAARLRGRYVPLRVYRGAVEEFDLDLLGRFDLALLLNVIYHVGRRGRERLPDELTLDLQVDAVRRVAAVARTLVFGANPLHDEGYGKGMSSLLRIVAAAGLEPVQEARYDDPRGYVLLARSPNYDARLEDVPLSRLVSKYFLPPRLSAEKEYVDRYQADPAAFNSTSTRYYRLRTGLDTWLAPEQAHLPAGLARPPEYWVVPWSCKPRPTGVDGTARFAEVERSFRALIESVLGSGFDPGRARVRVYKLVDPDRGAVYQYVDGNQRLGVLAHVAERDGVNPVVPVVVEQEVRRERLRDYPLAQQLVEEGRLAEDDVERWFANAFWFLS